MRTSCISNLKQNGVGILMYAQDCNYLPVCGWPKGQNPWQTYSACRVDNDGVTVTRGFMGLGLLFRNKLVPDARVFYCPSAKKLADSDNYEYYSKQGPWPSAPAGATDQVRCYYNFYPQLKEVQPVAGAVGLIPRLVFTPIALEIGGTFEMIVMKQNEMNLNKSMVVDKVHDVDNTAHRVNNKIGGLNALFGDGHVLYQTANKLPAAFEPTLWNNGTIIGNDPPPSPRFRQVMNSWRP
jgi:prepilin-type processing-associated H-X9-DG protein